MTTSVNNPVPAGFDALPVLDLRDPNFTVEGNRILKPTPVAARYGLRRTFARELRAGEDVGGKSEPA